MGDGQPYDAVALDYTDRCPLRGGGAGRDCDLGACRSHPGAPERCAGPPAPPSRPVDGSSRYVPSQKGALEEYERPFRSSNTTKWRRSFSMMAPTRQSAKSRAMLVSRRGTFTRSSTMQS
ncbi:hypothetical protein PG997_009179 [Apiospora hydei]|uniref:Uncharacterized protein n=1 Tax=Apiospora hydei TaxID=1337664 RepID=A0ABR1VTD2_9PEZI